MSIVTQKACLPTLAFIAFGFVSPVALAAQLVSARPASVGLTVVVPPRSGSDPAVTSEGIVSVIRTTPTAIDLETMVGLASRPPARIEVRLGSTWGAESTRVFVQNRRGEFERLLGDASIVAIDAPPGLTATRSAIRFRVESIQPRAAMAIPLEYRLRVGGGDQFSVWSFPSVLHVNPGAEHDGARE